ncbi:MAG: T9SS type A sorting domain-containing protein [Candidatus Hatepunaea meridiana]|nr:T9SS type A sorting domain-containing protein [Candidatus Hatepunaea meridiana]
MKKLIILLQLLTVGILHAQPDSLWSHTYGGLHRQSCYSVIQTRDGGFALAGSQWIPDHRDDGYLIKTDARGGIEWERMYAPEENNNSDVWKEVIQTGDGGYLLAGQTSSYVDGSPYGWVVKTDEDGEVEWMQNYGGNAPDDFSDLIETLDDCYLLVGRTSSFRSGTQDIFLVKIDRDGEEVWSRAYDREHRSEWGGEVIATIDSCFIIAGSTGGGFVSDGYVIKVDADGEEVWSNSYGSDLFEQFRGIVQTPDGGYVLIGNQEDLEQEHGQGRDIYLVKIDGKGEEIWSRTYGDRMRDSGADIVLTEDGDFVIAGKFSYVNPPFDEFYLLRVEPDGEEIWSETFGGRSHEWCNSMVQTYDGGYALTGYTSSFREEDQGHYNIWLLKTGTDILRWVSLPDTGFVQDSTLIYNLDYFYDFVSPSVYQDSALVFSIRDRRNLNGYIEDDQLIITADEDWVGLDSLRLTVYEEDDRDNTDRIYLRITVSEPNDVTDPPHPDIPETFELIEAYPNPFNSTTSIQYQLPEASNVTMQIFDVSGREVATLINGEVVAGYHSVAWEANVPSGIYFCRMEAGGFSKSIKIVLNK